MNEDCTNFNLPNLEYSASIDYSEKEPAIARKCLISNMDQPELEPGTSRL